MKLAPGFVLPVDKPEGPTSHDIVDAARRGLGIRKVGHTGTLDPFASGLLLLCVGRATRLAEFLSGLDKVYEATALLGVRTDTLDRDGEVVEERSGWEALSADEIGGALGALRGTLSQVPPQFSAKKVSGVAMHRRARRGEHVELSAHPVTVHDIELIGVDLPSVRFRVRCSSGTYVRALARDLGEGLRVGAHLTALRRTAIGSVDVADALEVSALGDAGAVAAARIDPLRALAHLPAVHVGPEDADRLVHGQRVHGHEGIPSGLVAVAAEGRLLAIADAGEGILRPRKVFAG